MTSEFPAKKIQDMMADCTVKTCDHMYQTIYSYFDEMPDVKENRSIFADSVIAGVFVKIALERTHLRNPDFRRKYVRTLINHVKDRAYEFITEDATDDIEKRLNKRINELEATDDTSGSQDTTE